MACAPPEKKNTGRQTESGVKAGEATSAEDFGGMDALVEAAQEEGELNVIALPPDWANYGEIIKAFADKYDIKVNSDQPDGASQDEINAANQLEGHRPRARRLRPRPVGRAGQHRHVRAVQGGDLRRHPRRVQGPGRHLGQRLRRLHVDRLRLGQGARTMTSVEDLLEPEFKGKVALNGDPTEAGAAFSGVMMAAIANGGSADDIAPGVDFFGELKDAGNFLPVDPTPATIESGQTPVVIDWDYLNAAETRQASPTWKVVVPGRGRRRPATTSRRSTPTRRTRPPPGCGRSSSTATRARTSGSRAAPVRSAPTRWRRPAPSTQALYDALPEVDGHAGIPTDEQTEKAGGVPGRQLVQGHRLTAGRCRRPAPAGRAGVGPAVAVGPALGLLPFLVFLLSS